MWTSKLFDEYKENGLIYALSSEKDGNMSFKRPSGKPYENREKFLKGLKINPGDVTYMKMVHGSRVAKANEGGFLVNNVDGLYTLQKGVFLFGTYADCVPIFIYEPKSGLAGLIHAGWRGVVREVVPSFFDYLKREKIDTGEVLVTMGPHIRSCCFEVGEEVLALFSKDEIKNKRYVDLSIALKKQILKEGVKEENIEVSTICTLSDEGYFSHRREGNESAMGAVIGIQRG